MKEKIYALALFTLVLIGVSAAWAAYSGTSTVTVSKIEDIAALSASDKTFTVSIYRRGWFYGTKADVFTITDPSDNTKAPATNKIYVTVILLNAPELRRYFRYLTIKVDLNNGTSHVIDYITLTNAEVLLDASTLKAGGGVWTIDLTAYGYAWKTGSNIQIQLIASVEPAEASTE